MSESISENVARFLVQHLGTVPYLVLAFGLFLVGLALLLLTLRRLLANRQRGHFDGLVLGFTLAIWASLCWILVPYCGGYPCLPSLIVVKVVFQGLPVSTLPEGALIHVVNFVFWPATCRFAFYLKALLDHVKPVA
jgi:hypothetical protein